MSVECCAACGGLTVTTIDSRPPGPKKNNPTPWHLRRKGCLSCGAQWRSFELPEAVLSQLIEIPEPRLPGRPPTRRPQPADREVADVTE